MVNSSFYNTAKNYAEKVRQERPAFYTQPEGSICLIMAEDQEIFTGVTGIKIVEGNVVPVHSEANAIMEMAAANKPRAKQMVIVSFKDLSVIKPCDECLDMLLKADDENSKCEIAISIDESDTAINLKAAATSVSAEFLEKKTEETEAPTLGAPAEFVSGFEFDASNPFMDEPAEPAPEVKTIQDDIKQQEAAAFAQQQPMYGQQQPMYGQQQPMYGQQQPMYGQQQPMYGQQQPMYGQQQPMYGQQQPMYGQQQSMYTQQQSVYTQQQAPAGGYAQQAPAGEYSQGADKSVYITDVISTAAAGQYQPSPGASKYAAPGSENGILKQRLASIFNEDDDPEGENSATMSKDDLKKQAKEMKKAAKMSAQYNKKPF